MTAKKKKVKAATMRSTRSTPTALAKRIVEQLDAIEADGGDGELTFGGGETLHVSSLSKVYFPDAERTKGDLMRYYALVSPVLLPIIKDRPMILKRYPDGVGGPSFFQQNAGKTIPKDVRIERMSTTGGERAERLIGGDLLTLLATVQIGTIPVHTWQSRIQSHQFADTTTIDLDPGDDVPFSEVVTLAKQIKAELDKFALASAIKTSGSSGLHIVLPLPAKTTFDEAAQVAERIAERIVDAQPKRATVERSVRARPERSIYVDAQQNAEGKSVVAAYSVRERAQATVSAPLDWRELRRALKIEAFTLESMPARLRKVGDLWGEGMKRRNSRRAIDRVLDAS
jgi:bifunctional non-homologous end joining protein LigD